MTSAITATGLRKSFGGKIVRDVIGLEVGAVTTFSLLGPNGAISVDRAGADVDAKTSNGSIRIGEVARSSVVLGTPAGGLEIGIAEGTAARLEVNTGHGHVTTCWRTPPGPKRLTRPSRCAATPPTATSPSAAPGSLPALE